MAKRVGNTQALPINITGSSTFGVDNKISAEITYNMYKTDDWMTNYIGYQIISNPGAFINGKSRRIYVSVVSDVIIQVVANIVYAVQVNVNYNVYPNTFIPTITKVGTLNTSTSPVYISEDVQGNILISDTLDLWVYSPQGPDTFYQVVLGDAGDPNGFVPGYIWFGNGNFIMIARAIVDAPLNPNYDVVPYWTLSEYADPDANGQVKVTFPGGSQFTQVMNSKAGRSVGGSYVPSKGNLILVMGENVTEPWFYTAGQLFPYQKNTAFNIDYGCINPNTICELDQAVIWLGRNEKTGPMIFMSDGGIPKPIVTDGIDRQLAALKYPDQSEAFILRINSHIFYHLNFTNPADNLSLFYDIKADAIYHACDEEFNYFGLSQIVLLDNEYYGISTADNNLYHIPKDNWTYNGLEPPLIRICKTVLLEDQTPFIATDIGFTIKQGNTNPQYNFGLPFNLTDDLGNLFITDSGDYLITDQDSESNPYYPRVDFSFSLDGGETYSQIVGRDLNPLGQRQNILDWFKLGRMNTFTAQFRFYGINKFVCTDGILNIRQ